MPSSNCPARRPVPPDDSLPRQLGRDPSVTQVYDFSKPEAPQILTPFRVRGRLVPGHTWAGEPDAPVVVREGDIIGPGAAQTADLRCPRRAATVTIRPLDANTPALIEQRAG